MNIQKQFSLGVAFFMTLFLTLLLIGSIKLLQAETGQAVVESELVINKSGPTATVTSTNTPTPTITPIQTVTPTITPTVTATNSALYLPVMILEPTPRPMPTATPTPRPMPTVTPTPLPCLRAEEEPNNGFGEADSHDPLCENVGVEGKFPEEEDEDDLYVIESKSGDLRVRLTNIPAGTNYQLVLYYGTTRIRESLNADNQDEVIFIEDVKAGTYYARVFRHQGSSSQPYRIRWQNE